VEARDDAVAPFDGEPAVALQVDRHGLVRCGHPAVVCPVMEFGLHLPNAGPFANGPDILRVARTAEELGFHSVWLFDHLFTPTNLESKYPYSPDGSYPMLPELPFYDPVSVMAALAGATERIKFGTRVLIATYRHPVALAKELATTDALAGGRMILGVGAGWMAEEFDAVDVPMDERLAG